MLLLAAGVSGALPPSALAGDKIEFSRASETLAAPTVERPDSEPSDASAFSFRNSSPQPRMRFTITPAPAVTPSRRNDSILRIGNGGLGSDQDRFGQNDPVEKSPWAASATDYSFNPATNSLNAARAWGTQENPDGLGRGLDKPDQRYGQTDARLNSLASTDRRDGQNEPGFGVPGSRAWASRRDDASSTRTSLSDLLKQQNKSPLASSPSLFRSPFSDAKAMSAWGSSSLLPSDQPSLSPLNPAEPGYNAKDPSGRAPVPGRSSARQDNGNAGGLPAVSAWGNLPGYGFQAPDPAPAFRRPLPPPAPGAAQPQHGGATLPWPKKPGAIFN